MTPFFQQLNLKSNEFIDKGEINEISVLQLSRNFENNILFKLNLSEFQNYFFNFMKIRCDVIILFMTANSF